MNNSGEHNSRGTQQWTKASVHCCCLFVVFPDISQTSSDSPLEKNVPSTFTVVAAIASTAIAAVSTRLLSLLAPPLLPLVPSTQTWMQAIPGRDRTAPADHAICRRRQQAQVSDQTRHRFAIQDADARSSSRSGAVRANASARR